MWDTSYKMRGYWNNFLMSCMKQQHQKYIFMLSKLMMAWVEGRWILSSSAGDGHASYLRLFLSNVTPRTCLTFTFLTSSYQPLPMAWGGGSDRANAEHHDVFISWCFYISAACQADQSMEEIKWTIKWWNYAIRWLRLSESCCLWTKLP